MLENALTIDDLKRMARRRVPKMFFDYADSGAWTEQTYNANESDFAKLLLRQRVLVDMTDRNLATEMIGEPVSMPVALAPTGFDTGSPIISVARLRSVMSTSTRWRSRSFAKSLSLAL